MGAREKKRLWVCQSSKWCFCHLLFLLKWTWNQNGFLLLYQFKKWACLILTGLNLKKKNFKGGFSSGCPLLSCVFIMQMSKPLKGTVLIIKALAMNFCTVRSATQCACKTIRSSGKDQFPAIISVCLSPGHWVIQSEWNILKSIKSLTHCDFPQKKPCQHDIRISSRQQALVSPNANKGVRI